MFVLYLFSVKGLLSNTTSFLTRVVEHGNSSGTMENTDVCKEENKNDSAAVKNNSVLTSSDDHTSTQPSKNAEDTSTQAPTKSEKSAHISPKSIDISGAPKADTAQIPSFSLAHILNMIKEDK